MNRTETEACISPVLSTAGLGAVLTYRTSGHNRACGQAIGANGAGDFSVLIFGTPDDADNHARDILRKLESRGYRIESANIVRNEDGWGGSPITTAQAPNASLNIALGGNDSTSTENLVDSHEFDIADVGLIAVCRKLIAEISELEASPLSEEALDILRSKNKQLEAERDQFKEDYQRTCHLVAQMHMAAMNGVIGPKRGVIEDIADLREERDQLAAQNEALLKELEAYRG